MARVSFDLPDDAMQIISPTTEEFAWALRLAAAMFWYGRSEVTMHTAAAIAGLDLRDFFTALSRNGLDIFIMDTDDIRHDLDVLAQRHTHGVTGG